MEETVVAFAPGRVELLGNHTDYNQGLAIAAAIHLGVTVRAERVGASVVEISSETNGRGANVSLENLPNEYTPTRLPHAEPGVRRS